MNDPRIVRWGGWAALAAVPVLVLSLLFLFLFFGGAGAIFGPLNDLTVVVVALLLVPVALAIMARLRERGEARRWFEIVSWLAIAGLVVIALGQAALVVGLLSLDGSFMTGSAGVVPVLVWLAAQAWLGFRSGFPPRRAAWSIVAVAVAAVAMPLLLSAGLDLLTWLAAVTLLGAIIAYLLVVGRSLR